MKRTLRVLPDAEAELQSAAQWHTQSDTQDIGWIAVERLNDTLT